MPFVATSPEADIGQVIGNGHCVAYVRAASAAPHTSKWRRGEKVRDGALPANIAIATFDPDGTYGNHTDGQSHAAIFLADHGDSILVTDQWVGQPVHQRVIRYKGGSGDPANDADQYYVIESPQTEQT